jgi:hypothetical protein
MKNKKSLLILLFLLSFMLVACSNTNNEIKDDSNTEISTEEKREVVKEDITYYYNAYLNIENFYKGFYNINDAIEDNDKDIYNMYITYLLNCQKNIKEMKVPSKYNNYHTYLVDGVDKYIDGITKLNESYKNNDVELYLESDSILSDAKSHFNAYLNYMYVDFESMGTFMSSALQNEYYMSLIEFYTYDKTFSVSENKTLFELERTILNFTALKKDLLLKVCNNENYKKELKSFENNLETFKNIEVSDSYLKNYKEALVPELETYVRLVKEFCNILDTKYDSDKIISLSKEADNINYNLYMSLKDVSDFYKTYNIDIGFEAKLKETEEIFNSLENQKQ